MLQTMFRINIPKYIKIFAKLAAWLLGVFTTLFLIIAIALLFPSVQTFITGKVTSSLSKSTGAVISVERVAVRFPVSAGLRGIYLEDKEGDTLLYANSIFINIRMLSLLQGKVNIRSLELTEIVANIKREAPDTVFNFQFLTESDREYPGNSEDPVANGTLSGEVQVDETTAPNSTMEIIINRVDLNNARIKFADHFSGVYLEAGIGRLRTSLGDSDLTGGIYHAGKTSISELTIDYRSAAPAVVQPDQEEDAGLPDIWFDLLELDNFDVSFSSENGGGLKLNGGFFSVIPREIDLASGKVGLSSISARGITSLITNRGGKQSAGTENSNVPRSHISTESTTSSTVPRNQISAENENSSTDPRSQISTENENSSNVSGRHASAGNSANILEDFHFSFSEIMDWTVEIDNVVITDSGFAMSGEEGGAATDSFDPGNFTIGDFNLNAHGIYVSPQQIDLTVNNISMLISDSFKLSHFNAELKLDWNSGLIATEMETGKSSLSFALKSNHGLLETEPGNLGNTVFDLDLRKIAIGSDLSWFAPLLNNFYFDLPDAQRITATGLISGSISDLTVNNLFIDAPDLVSIEASGRFIDFPDPEIMFASVDRFSLSLMPQRLVNFLPDTLRPEGLSLPAWLTANGMFEGRLKGFDATIEINSEAGDLAIIGSVNEDYQKETIFSGKLHGRNLEVGKVMGTGIPELPLTIELDLSGRGLRPEDMELTSALSIGNLSLNGHLYGNIDLQMTLKDSVANLSGSYRDDLLSLSADISSGLFSGLNFVKGLLEIEYADLGGLGIMEDDILVAALIDTDVVVRQDGFFGGDLKISGTTIASEGEIYTIPDLAIKSDVDEGLNRVLIDSGFLRGKWTSNFNPLETPEMVTRHISGYMSADTTGQPEDEPHRYFDLDMIIIPDEFVNMVLIPGIGHYDTLLIAVQYDSRNHLISMSASLDDLEYGTMGLRSFRAELTSGPNRIDFGLSVDSLNYSGSSFNNFNIRGGISDEILEASFSLSDNSPGELFYISISAGSEQGVYQVSLDHSKLVLNRQEWKLDPGNLILAGKDTLSINNFVLESMGSRLTVNTLHTEETGTWLNFGFSEFDIFSIAGFMEESMTVPSGKIDGDFTIRDVRGEPSFLAGLEIRDLSLGSDTIGLVTVNAENPDNNLYNLLLTAEHEGTSIKAEGSYLGGENPRMDIDIILDKLNLALIEAFTGGNITQLQGFVTGRMRASGTPSSPELTGEININETGFTVPALNTGFGLRNETIRFDRQNIRFADFTINDSRGRSASLRGNVNFSSFENLILNVDLNTRNFMVMDQGESSDQPYHGRLLVDSDIRLRGTHLNPSLEGNLRLNEGSSFSFTLPQPAPEAIGDEGVVEFISAADSLFLAMVHERVTDGVVTQVERMTVNLNVEIDRQTELRIVIDDLAGDFLELKGGGVLSLGIDPGGRMSLSGRYEIAEGSYLLTFYDVIRRNFRIRPGSSIVWTGDPLDATVDITAIYALRTSARDLMRTHTGADQAQAARLRQQYPFLVYLNMTDNLMSPGISFQIDMPPEHRNAIDGSLMARINEINQNDSELNKQVFALLILGSFVQENPLEFSGGAGLSSTARSSGSQILTQQLNRMSDRFIRGLDVSFELESYEDFEGGQAAGRTELQMEVSRNFFDERIRITVGGNIELEDETRRQTSAGDIAGDFSIEYLVTPEGNLVMRGFRNRDYGDLFEGDVTETGVALAFSRSYNRFRELFRKRDDDQEIIDQQEDVIDDDEWFPDWDEIDR